MISPARAAQALELAVSVPAGSAEAAAWRTRNLSELLLTFIVLEGPIGLIDQAVANLDVSGPLRLRHRIYGLRQLAGMPPPQYSAIRVVAPPRLEVDGRLVACAQALISFAANIPSAPIESGRVVSAKSGVGDTCVREFSSWRAAGKGGGFEVRDTDVPAELIWRSWTGIDKARPTIFVPDELLDATRMDVWWGIHNGTHLDHLSALIAKGDDPLTIEFGRGLLVAEAVAMVQEILAGAESVVRGTPQHGGIIAEGILERVARDPIISEYADVKIPASLHGNPVARDEFAWLPTLSRAYIEGGLRLIATDFVNQFIPLDMADALSRQCSILSAGVPALNDLVGKSKVIFDAKL